MWVSKVSEIIGSSPTSFEAAAGSVLALWVLSLLIGPKGPSTAYRLAEVPTEPEPASEDPQKPMEDGS